MATSRFSSQIPLFDDLPDCALIRPRQVALLLGISCSTLWRLARTSPDFPKPLKISARVSAFRAGDLRRFLRSRTER